VSMGDFQRMMRQAQKMQAELQRVQEEVSKRTVEASSGGGAVRATANGSGQLVGLVIDPGAVDPADVEMLQDLVVAAVNEALRSGQEMMAREMARVTAGLGLPGLGGLPGMPGLPPG
jgi:DNA-binding YbaB/EbfC family protein